MDPSRSVRPRLGSGSSSSAPIEAYSRDHMFEKYDRKYWTHVANANDMTLTPEERQKAEDRRDKWESRKTIAVGRLKEQLEELVQHYGRKAIKYHNDPVLREKALKTQKFYQNLIEETRQAVNLENAYWEGQGGRPLPGQAGRVEFQEGHIRARRQPPH